MFTFSKSFIGLLLATLMVCLSAQEGYCSGVFGWLWPERWVAFYYPDRSNLTKNTQSKELGSLEQCRSWVQAERLRFSAPEGSDDYECGLNCRPAAGGEMFMCDKTIR
jgi:hypothetical protein